MNFEYADTHIHRRDAHKIVTGIDEQMGSLCFLDLREFRDNMRGWPQLEVPRFQFFSTMRWGNEHTTQTRVNVMTRPQL